MSMLNYYSLQSKSKKSSIPPPIQQSNESLIVEDEVDVDEIPSIQKSNDVSEKWAHLERDPGKRQSILEYPSNVRDEVRRAYLLKGPYQPILTTYHARDIYGKDRSFSSSWFDEFSWLEYSVEKKKVYCFPCYLFYSKSGIGNSKTTFVNDGFDIWNQKNKLKVHEGTKPTSHHNNCVRFCEVLMNQKCSIESSYTQYSTKEKEDYFVRLKASLKAVKYLLRGGLAFRGHDEGKKSTYKGHFLELLELMIEISEHIAAAVKSGGGNVKMTSPIIQKDLANACAVEIVKKIVEEIGDDIFCVLVDESGDCSGKEQMAVVVRFVDARGFIVERFIGIAHVVDTSAIVLKETLETVLSGVGLCISKLRGQGYDGASNMRGHLGGLKTLIQKENPQAYYVHCFAHQLQLALISIARHHEDVDMFFLDVTRLVTFIRGSNKRMATLCKKQARHLEELLDSELVETGTGLNQEMSIARPGDTRWGSHFRTLMRLQGLFTPIVELLEDIRRDKSGGGGGEPKRLLLGMQNFDFIFMLHLMIDVLVVTNELSEALQKGDQDIVNAMDLVQHNKEMFQEMQDSGWGNFYEKVTSFCGQLDIDVPVPDMDSRYVKDHRSKRCAPFVTNLHYFKNDCFLRIIDLVLKELNERFTPENMELLHCVACLSPSSSFEAFDIKSLVRLARLYPNDFVDVEDVELSGQLDNYIRSVKADDRFSNLRGLSDLSKTLVQTKKNKTYKYVYRLVKLALTLPVATASVERVFSGMKYVKDHMRNKMSNPWLNDCLITFVEKEVFSTIDDLDIIKRFQSMKKRKVQLELK